MSVLVNNVGVASTGEGTFLKTPVNDILNMLACNVFPQTFMSYFMLPKLKNRGIRGLIINLASVAALFPIPCGAVYSATKAYNNYLSKVLSYENTDIDIFSLRPGYTTTNMTKQLANYSTITSDDCAESCLKYVSCWNDSECHWLHRFNGWVMQNTPEFMLNPIAAKSILETL